MISDPEREAAKRAFLSRTGLSGARREPMAGDASTRAYERLHLADGSTRVLMDAPPSAESEPAGPDATAAERAAKGYNALARLAACRVDAYVATAGWLRGQGLSAPEVFDFDVGQGFALTEDLGGDLFAGLTAQGGDPRPLYEAAVDVLVALQAAPAPEVLDAPAAPPNPGASWPLLTYDDLALKTGADLFLEWWPRHAGLPPPDAEAMQAWEALWAPIRARGEAGAEVFAHRDYHAENLIWLPQREGVARVGLLDFQDAVRAHPAWDLLHLLQDARRDVAPELEAAMLERYLDARCAAVERAAFLADYRALAALNCTRILFIFARQVAGFGKPRYAAFMPRTWLYLERDLGHPELEGLRAWFDRHVPPDTRPRQAA